jgi:spermidine/putrescine transport system substrate-binding protein
MHTSTTKAPLLGTAGVLALVAFCAGAPALAADKLTYFTWSGYELPDFNKSFIAAHPDGVEATMFTDDDDAFAKVKAGFRSDIAHPCYDKIARWNKEGLLQPIDTKRLKNWDKVFPVFKNLPDIQAGDGKVWMVPWDWGNTSITYRTDLIKNPEMSWNLLWDKQYSGRMSTIDAVHDTPVVAAIVAGVNPFDLSEADLAKVGAKLREQRPLMRSYSTDVTSVQQALASGEVIAAMTWNDSAVALKKQGVSVEFMKPKEGMLTWTCGFVLMKDAKNVDLAYEFMNSRMEPASSKELITQYGYGTANSEAFTLVPKEELDRLQLPADPEIALKTTIFLHPLKQNDELTKLFEKVKAGG